MVVRTGFICQMVNFLAMAVKTQGAAARSGDRLCRRQRDDRRHAARARRGARHEPSAAAAPLRLEGRPLGRDRADRRERASGRRSPTSCPTRRGPRARRCGSGGSTSPTPPCGRTSASSSSCTARRSRGVPTRPICSTGSSSGGSSRPRELSIERGVPADVARAHARLGVATTRGLLLDLLATRDVAAVDAAMEAFIDLYEAWLERVWSGRRTLTLDSRVRVAAAPGPNTPRWAACWSPSRGGS